MNEGMAATVQDYKKKPVFSRTRLLVIVVLFVILGAVLLQLSRASDPRSGGSQLYIETSAASVKSGEEFEAVVRVNSDGQTINAVQALVAYPTDKLELVGRVDAQSSAFNIDVIAQENKGVVNILRGNYDPLLGSDLELARLTFRAIADSGNVTLDVQDNSFVVTSANGSNILKQTGDVVVALSPGELAPSATLSLSPEPASVPLYEHLRVKVLLDSQLNGVSQIKARIQYPENMLEFVDVDTTGSAFASALEAIADGGVVSIKRGSDSPVQTDGAIVATIVFKAKVDVGLVDISLLEGSFAAAPSGQNILRDRSGTQVGLVPAIRTNTAPTFTSPSVIAVAENQDRIVSVTASDPDGDPFSLAITGGSDVGRFALRGTGAAYQAVDNSSTLYLEPAANFEQPSDNGQDNRYDVVVTATDSNGNQSSQAIAVTIQDANEWPTFDNESRLVASAVRVKEGQTHVGTFTAEHEDAGQSLEYQIIDGADKSAFVIDPKAGVLTFNAAPDLENPTDQDSNNTYEVVLLVSDSSAEHYYDELGILVTVTDADEEVIATTRVSAGADQAIDLASGIALELSGTALGESSDSFEYAWSVQGGPAGGVRIDDPHSASTTAAFAQTGTYTLRLHATSGASAATDTIVVTVTDSRGSSDGDGVSDAVEDAAPMNGDVAGDASVDSLQGNVVSTIATYSNQGKEVAEDANGFVSLVAESCSSVQRFANVSERDLDVSDEKYTYPRGIFDITLVCGEQSVTQEVVLYFDDATDTSAWQWRTYNKSSGEYVEFDSDKVRYEKATVDGTQVTRVVFTVDEGGVFDSDGQANGNVEIIIGPAMEGADDDIVSLSEARSTGVVPEGDQRFTVSTALIPGVIAVTVVAVTAAIAIFLRKPRGGEAAGNIQSEEHTVIEPGGVVRKRSALKRIKKKHIRK